MTNALDVLRPALDSVGRPQMNDLETRGYVVIPGFLTDGEVRALKDDFEAQAWSGNSNYKIKHVSKPAVAAVRHKLEAVAAGASAHSGTAFNTIRGGTYFSTEKREAFNGWHQDYESYYTWQTHRNSLNLWIPIVKPDRSRSNLSILPFDELKYRSPDVFERVVDAGASRWLNQRRRTIIRNDNEGGRVGTLHYDIDDIAVSPHLSAGDLLILRGDIVHRTQDRATRRVAVSFRLTHDGTVLTTSGLAKGGLSKMYVMAQNKDHYLRVLDAFKTAETDQITLGELDSYFARASTLETRTQADLLSLLLTHRGIPMSVAAPLSRGLVRVFKVVTMVRRWESAH